MTALLVIAFVLTVYLVGFTNGRAQRDDKAAELLSAERHARLVAEEMLKVTRAELQSELFMALERADRLNSQNEMLVLKLVRQGIERECLDMMMSRPAEKRPAPALRAVT